MHSLINPETEVGGRRAVGRSLARNFLALETIFFFADCGHRRDFIGFAGVLLHARMIDAHKWIDEFLVADRRRHL